MAIRLAGPGQAYEGLVRSTPAGPRWTGKVAFADNLLRRPLGWKEPRRVFVNSMSDLFHETVPDAWIDKIWAVMLLAQRHVYMILTKRPERMRAYLTAPDHQARVLLAMDTLLGPKIPLGVDTDGSSDFPCASIWIGVSVEDQASADERIPLLLQTPAAVRFISAEPLLGPVDLGLGRWIRLPSPVRSELPFVLSYLPAGVYRASSNAHGALSVQHETTDGLLGVKPTEFERLPVPDWVINGGESGGNSRPCNLAWLRSIVAQCKTANVPAFTKQIGANPWWDGIGLPPEGDHLYLESDVILNGKVGWRIDLLRDRKGGDMSEWPSDLRVREWP